MKCKQCGNTTDRFDYDYNGGVCDRCKTIRTVKFALILGWIGLVIMVCVGHIHYGYELNKCSKLKSSESQYGFSHVIETNAEYNSHCYFLRNHPLAIPIYYIGGGSLGMTLFATIGVIIGVYTKPFRV
jgi:hypothetical protein